MWNFSNDANCTENIRKRTCCTRPDSFRENQTPFRCNREITQKPEFGCADDRKALSGVGLFHQAGWHLTQTRLHRSIRVKWCSCACSFKDARLIAER